MSSKKIRTAQKGRKCKYPECKRVLSIYNLEENCNVHISHLSGKSLWEARGRMPGKESME